MESGTRMLKLIEISEGRRITHLARIAETQIGSDGEQGELIDLNRRRVYGLERESSRNGKVLNFEGIQTSNLKEFPAPPEPAEGLLFRLGEYQDEATRWRVFFGTEMAGFAEFLEQIADVDELMAARMRISDSLEELFDDTDE